MASVARAGPPWRVAAFRALPKIDLHVHLEGSLGSALLCRFAARRGEQGPEPGDLSFQGFSGFLKAFARVCSYLQTADDFRQAVVDMGRRLHHDGVVHAEVFFSPTVHTRRGIPYADLCSALEDGAAQVETGGGPSLLFIADGVRQWGVPAMDELVASMSRRPSGRVVGLGLGGEEVSIPAHRYGKVFAQARDLGLVAVVHAGETGPAGGVREAVTELGACRIGHGIAAADDAGLMSWLRDRKVALDVCLTSNRRTGALPRSLPHPLPRLIASGLQVTLGTDDPALFRTTLSAEYVRAGRCGVTLAQLAQVAAGAAAASLLPADRRRRLHRHMVSAWS